MGLVFQPASHLSGLFRMIENYSRPIGKILCSLCRKRTNNRLGNGQYSTVWKSAPRRVFNEACVSCCRIRSSSWHGRQSWRGKWTTREWPFASSTIDRIKVLGGCASTRRTTSSCATVSTVFKKNANGPTNLRPLYNDSSCINSTEINIINHSFYYFFLILYFFFENSCCIISPPSTVISLLLLLLMFYWYFPSSFSLLIVNLNPSHSTPLFDLIVCRITGGGGWRNSNRSDRHVFNVLFAQSPLDGVDQPHASIITVIAATENDTS